MKVDIMDKGSIYNYKNATSISIQNDCNTMIITCIDDNSEEHNAVVGYIPEYVAINNESAVKTGGHWEHIKDKFKKHLIRCSCCNYTEPEYITFSRNYCPDCGAKMNEVKE